VVGSGLIWTSWWRDYVVQPDSPRSRRSFWPTSRDDVGSLQDVRGTASLIDGNGVLHTGARLAQAALELRQCVPFYRIQTSETV
jgi:hypothetical protein